MSDAGICSSGHVMWCYHLLQCMYNVHHKSLAADSTNNTYIKHYLNLYLMRSVRPRWRAVFLVLKYVFLYR